LPTDENLFFKREISDEDFSALVPCLAKRDWRCGALKKRDYK
jgi:hypothetical protein